MANKKTAESAATTAVVNAANGLNLREGPHASFKVLATLPDCAEVSVLDLPDGTGVPGWTPVSAGDLTGWVMTQFLQTAE